MQPLQTAKERPAETATPVAMAIAMLVGRAFHLDADTVAYIAIVVAFVPAAVTWLVHTIRTARKP